MWEEKADAMAAMESMVAEMIENLVDEPQAVSVLGVIKPQGFVIEVHVSEADRGRVIGRGGQTARSLRSIVAAAAGKHRLHCELVLYDGGHCMQRTGEAR